MTESRLRYLLIYRDATGKLTEQFVWTRFILTDIAVLQACGCTDIRWTKEFPSA